MGHRSTGNGSGSQWVRQVGTAVSHHWRAEEDIRLRGDHQDVGHGDLQEVSIIEKLCSNDEKFL